MSGLLDCDEFNLKIIRACVIIQADKDDDYVRGYE